MNKKEEIKNRIDLINKGEVPKGYKKEHGYCIPQEWEWTRFNKLFNRITKKNNIGCDNVLTISAQHGLINQQKFFKKNIASSDTSNYFLLEKGDFAYNKSYSAGYPYGTIKKLKLYDKGIVSPLYICFNIKENTANSEYIEQYFDANKFNSEILAIAQEGARNHGLLNMGIDDFFNCRIINPPLQEQEKIAEILNCCDKVIELKQKLLDEKRKEKRNILNKIFCNNFTDYKFIKIKDIAQNICDGDWIESKDQTASGIRLIQTGNIGMGQFLDKRKSAKFISEDTFKSLNCTEVVQGDILISRLPDPIGRACIVPKLETKCVTAVDCMIVKLKKEYLPEYIIQYMNTFKYFKNVAKYTNSSTRDRIPRKELENIKIPIIDIEKQKLISNYLSNIDLSLFLLEQELEQYKQLKKSLSQLLLTGIVRVGE